MLNLLDINIRQFDEGESEGSSGFSDYVDESGNLDVDQLISDYTSEYPEGEETPEAETPEEPEETEETPLDTSEEVEPTQEQVGEKQTADQAFANMRRQLEANEPLAKWVQELATQQGFQNPQELIDAYEEQKIAREAEAQGVPVDVYKRLHTLEQENKTAKEQAVSQRFNFEVEQTINKYGLKDEDLSKVYDYMAQNGYEAGSIPFEDAYILANRDTLIKQAEERGRQTYLESKQKKQQQATPNIGTNASDTKGQDDLDMSTEGIFNKFKEFGIEID